jgi:hypothetical protein
VPGCVVAGNMHAKWVIAGVIFDVGADGPSAIAVRILKLRGVPTRIGVYICERHLY